MLRVNDYNDSVESGLATALMPHRRSRRLELDVRSRITIVVFGRASSKLLQYRVSCTSRTPQHRALPILYEGSTPPPTAL